jgi:hypothetical protein
MFGTSSTRLETVTPDYRFAHAPKASTRQQQDGALRGRCDRARRTLKRRILPGDSYRGAFLGPGACNAWPPSLQGLIERSGSMCCLGGTPVVKHEAWRSARAACACAAPPKGKVGVPFQAAARDTPTNPAAKKLASRPPSVRSPAATSFRPAKCPSCSGSRTRRSTTSRAAASYPHAALADVGCSSATGSPPLSRRSTSPARGAPRTTTSGGTTAIRNSGSPERYSEALLRGPAERRRIESEAPKPTHTQALQEAGATGLEPAASGVTGRRSNQTELRPLGGSLSIGAARRASGECKASARAQLRASKRCSTGR